MVLKKAYPGNPMVPLSSMTPMGVWVPNFWIFAISFKLIELGRSDLARKFIWTRARVPNDLSPQGVTREHCAPIPHFGNLSLYNQN